MDTIWLLVLVTAILSATAGFVYVVIILNKISGGDTGKNRSKEDVINEASVSAESVFNTEFREELKNRGRLHFENVINENAMFLQQDLRLTTSQLNEFMKDEIKKVLKEEFATYEETISNAKDQAVDAIQKTQTLVEEQRTVLTEALNKQADEEKARMTARFEQNMGDIINHYLIESIGTEIDLSDQLEYIFASLQENKEAILEDIRSGA